MDGADGNRHDSSIAQLITRLALAGPSAAAIGAPGRPPLSYAELAAVIETNVRALNGAGIGGGDRIAIVLPNGPEMAAAFLTVAAGAVAAPLNPGYRDAEFEFYFTDLGAKALVIEVGMASPARAVAARLAIPIIELVPIPAGPAGAFTFAGLAAAQWPARYCGPDDQALVLHTSGTTSRPKLVPLTHRNLCSSARHIAATLALTPADLCLNIMPLFHIHGLLAAVLASLAAGAGVICTPGFRSDLFFSWLAQCRPSWYTAVPTMHMAILTAADVHRDALAAAPLRFLRSSSASLPPQVMVRLERVFGAPVIEAYGMTEAAHQIASNPLPPARRKAGSVGLAAGPAVAIMNEAGALLPAGATGEIVLRGDNVTAGYENNSAANAAAFSDGWFRTGDQGRLDEDGYLYITGRLKEIINRGGEKVSPREVDEALLDHPDVIQAVAFAVPHPSLGEDVAAAVVLRPEAPLTAVQLRAWLFGRLAEFKIPNQLLVVADIPKGPTGKVQRIGLAEKLAAALQPVHAAPRTPAERRLADMFEAVLGRQPIGIHDNFFSAGGDSLTGAQVVDAIRRDLGCELPVTALFHYPTVAELAAALGGTAPQYDAIIARGHRDSPAPLAPAQRRLWLIQQLQPEISVNNVIRLLHLRGPLDRPALDGALRGIIQRHASLRTAFTAEGGEPRQTVLPRVDFALSFADLRALSAAQQKIEVERSAQREAMHAFHIAAPPLLRALLLQLGPNEHVLTLTLHHLVADGGSMGVLGRELEILYRAQIENQPNPLADLPIQYSDYAEWRCGWLKPDDHTALTGYWKQQLADLAPLALDSDRPPRKGMSYEARLCTATLTPRLSQDLEQLGRQEECSLFMTVLACFGALLYRYTGATDIVVGAPISERRHREETRDLIGCFVNTVALRCDLSGHPSFRAVLRRVRAMALQAYQHAALPFDAVVEAVRPQRAGGRNPLFDVMLNFHDAAWYAFRLDGLDVEARPISPLIDTALSLDMMTTQNGLKLTLKYQTDLFDEDRMTRMLAHLQRLMQECSAHPDQDIASLAMLTPAEHDQLAAWNNTAVDFPDGDATVQALFERQAARTPDAVALVFEQRELSYRDLNARADRLARRLRAAGDPGEGPIAICLERSVELVIAILAVLKTGGAYLPLDPAQPVERLLDILDDARAPLLLCDAAAARRLAAAAAHPIVLDGEELDDAGSEDNGRAAAPGSDAAPAYVLYTSGSTGRPKGVVNHQAGLRNRLLWMQQTFRLSDADAVLQKTPYTFDVSVWEFLWPLISGARLVLARPDGHRDPAYLAELIHEWRITVLHFVPSMLHFFLDTPDLARLCRSLRAVLCSGEALNADLIRRYYQCLDAPLHNLYGPTEAAIDVTHWPCPRNGVTDPVPIGRPIANTRIHLLDAQRRPVPIGVTGELYIGGVQVAHGYLNRPELTAACFGADPFSAALDARLYKTGDLARYLPDGTIQYLGRRDFQIKLRGQRIEPGEIEARLRQHASVQDCVVTLHTDDAGDARLVAYVAAARAEVDQDALKALLRSSLPDYMVPSDIVGLAALPLTSSGKIDRKALPVPPPRRSSARTGAARPHTWYESRIAQIWREVMPQSEPGLDDNFFELGGHSLLAARVVARVNHAFRTRLALRSLFDAPTISGLAQAVAHDKARALPQQALAELFIRLDALSDAEAERLLDQTGQ